ncbi:hypothetical protein HK098_001127 [Nowakowskiella sp. JEL0407]|nr:hypothetical protein HK098_001127 [Nowakowskiella sp. JEL0407]
MELIGSCSCGEHESVRFQVTSETPYPYMKCYCNTCTKTQGGGGYAINIMGLSNTFQILRGKEKVKKFQRIVSRNVVDGNEVVTRSTHERWFCGDCGSHLWAFDERWSDWIYPVASAIDTKLPVPNEFTHIMLNYKLPWVRCDEAGEDDLQFPEYPGESIENWHKKRGLFGKEN